MRLAPPSETPRRLTPRRGRGSWIGIGFLLLSGSCFFKLDPVVEGPADSGLTGIAGSLGGSPSGGAGGSSDPAGAANIGGSAGVSTDPGCPSGHKLCDDGRCLPNTPENGCGSTVCKACPSLSGAVIGCKEDQCAVLGCQPGFADCDGDSINDVGDIAGNGCEYQLATPQSSVTALEVPFAHILVDGDRDDWNGLPAYSFDQLCPNCNDQQTPPISADSSIPRKTDLDAYWRVAWDGDFFYLFVEAFDDHLYDAGVAGSNKCQFGAECEDSVQVFFDGLDNRASNPSAGYGNDDHRVFLGLSQRFSAPAQGQPQPEDVAVRTKRQSNFCYRIEAQFDWKYITGTKGGGSAPNKFPPAANQTYGFDISVNDWDPPISDANGIERQSQVFWVNPGQEYANKTIGFGPMKLIGPPPDAGQQ